MESSRTTFIFESETLVEKERQEMSNKRLKIGVIFLVLCFLLLNFVLVLVVMSWSFKFQKDNQELKKSHQELKEQFESLSEKFDQLKSNISLSCDVALLTPPSKNEDQEPIDPHSISSCSYAMNILPSPRSKKQRIYPHGNTKKIEVLCDFETDGGGWTVIQKRARGPKYNFYRNWTQFEKGFGAMDKNFWLGLENIHALTQNGDQELRIELEDFQGEQRWTKYSNFSISDASDFYRLAISGFYRNSTAGDSLTSNNGARFTTRDKDNDNYSGGNCAVEYHGSWWYPDPDGCGLANLNGPYLQKGELDENGIMWYHWKSDFESLEKTEMKIRKRK